MPGTDEFDALLKRCDERLAEIRLSVPDLEVSAPARPKALLAPPPPPPRPRLAPPPAPEPPPRAVLEPPPQAPLEEDAEEVSVFPPRVPARETKPLPSLENAPVRTPPARPAPRGGAPAPSEGRARAFALAGAAVLGAAVLVFWLGRLGPSALVLRFPDADAAAVQGESGNVLIARGGEVLTMSPAGAILERRPVAGKISSLRWDRGSLWTVDGTSAAVTERRDDERPTVFRLNHVPAALFVTGNTVWTVERNGHTIHQYLLSRSILGAMLQPLDLLEVQSLSADTIAVDASGTLWIADDRTRGLFRLRAQNGVYKIVDSAPLSPLLGPAGTLRGLTVEGSSVWIFARSASGGAAVLRRIPIASLDWTRA
jgi:hypothetical protein